MYPSPKLTMFKKNFGQKIYTFSVQSNKSDI